MNVKAALLRETNRRRREKMGFETQSNIQLMRAGKYVGDTAGSDVRAGASTVAGSCNIGDTANTREAIAPEEAKLNVVRGMGLGEGGKSVAFRSGGDVAQSKRRGAQKNGGSLAEVIKCSASIGETNDNGEAIARAVIEEMDRNFRRSVAL